MCMCVCVCEQFFNDIVKNPAFIVRQFPKPKVIRETERFNNIIACNYNRRIAIEKAILTKENENDVCSDNRTKDDVSYLFHPLCNGRFKCGYFNVTNVPTTFCPAVLKKLTIHYYCIGS